MGTSSSNYRALAGTDPNRRARMSAAVRRRAEEAHSLDLLSTRLAAIYADVLADRPVELPVHLPDSEKAAVA